MRGLCGLSNEIPINGTLPFNLRRILTVFIDGVTPVVVLTNTMKLSDSIDTILVRGYVIVTNVNALMRLCPM